MNLLLLRNRYVIGTTVVESGSVDATALYDEDFTSYVDTAALQTRLSSTSVHPRATETLNKTQLSIDTTTTFEGHQTMKQELSSVGVPQLFERWGNYTGAYGDINDVWVRVFVRFQPGFTTDTGGAPYLGGNSYKLTRVSLGETSRVIIISDQADGDPTGNMYTEMIFGSVSSVYPYLTQQHTVTPGQLFAGDAWWEWIMNVTKLSSNTGLARVWMQPSGSARQQQSAIYISDGRISMPAPRATSPTVNFNAPFTTVPSQSVWIGRRQIWDNSVTPDPLGLGDGATAALQYKLTVVLDDPNITVVAGGSAVTRSVTLTRSLAQPTRQYFINVNGHSLNARGPAPTFVSGLSMAASPSALLSGSSTSTLTISASAAAPTGSYTYVIYAIPTGTIATGGSIETSYFTASVTII